MITKTQPLWKLITGLIAALVIIFLMLEDFATKSKSETICDKTSSGIPIRGINQWSSKSFTFIIQRLKIDQAKSK